MFLLTRSRYQTRDSITVVRLRPMFRTPCVYVYRRPPPITRIHAHAHARAHAHTYALFHDWTAAGCLVQELFLTASCARVASFLSPSIRRRYLDFARRVYGFWLLESRVLYRPFTTYTYPLRVPHTTVERRRRNVDTEENVAIVVGILFGPGIQRPTVRLVVGGFVVQFAVDGKVFIILVYARNRRHHVYVFSGKYNYNKNTPPPPRH